MSTRIAFFDTKPYDRRYFQNHNQDFKFDITYLQDHLNETTVRLTRDFDAVCAFVGDDLNKKVIDALYEHGIKLIALRSAGFNNVDLDAAYGRIHVVRVPAYSPEAVAEHAVTLMLTLNRKTHRAYYRVRDSNFSINGLIGFDMAGKTVGIVGTGKIGKAAIRILNGFGMRVLAYDVYPDKEFAKKCNCTYVDLETIYKESDIISLHCPLTPQNVHIINQDTLSKMKNSVMIINTGRGKLIKTKDLIGALKSGTIGSAGLDVYEEESEYFFEDRSEEAINDDILARLLTFPNVLITSHQGFFTHEALTNITHTTLENIRLYFNEGKLPNEVCTKCCGEDGSIHKENRKTENKCFDRS